MTDQPSLKYCSPSDLATYLLDNRFQTDAMEATSFLLECTQCLPDAEAISAKIMGGSGGDDDGEDGDDSDDEVVEVDAVVAISESLDDDEDSKGQEEEAGDESNTVVAVSSGKAIELPKSIADDKKKKEGSGDDSPPTSPLAPMRRTFVEVSATTPRGKFDLTMHESTGIILKNKKDEIVTVPSSSVDTVIVFPKAEDCRMPSGRSNKKGPVKRPGPLVLVVLNDDEDSCDVTFRGKALKQICFQLPQTFVPFSNDDSGDGSGNFELEENKGGLDDDDDEKKDIELEWVDLLAKTFDVTSEQVVLVSNPAYLTDDGREERAYCGRYEFKSDESEGTSTTTAGMPYVKCYESVNDGVMYPLEEGLLFFKPPKFVPRSTLHSIQCGRGGGDSRYVDLVATLEGDESAVEFSNIAREEVRVLNDYIHKTLIKAMAKDAAEGEGEEEDGNELSTSSDNGKDSDSVVEIRSGTSGDEDDEDLSSDGGRKRSRRAASKGAREATKAQLQSKEADDSDEDEEEEDFMMESDIESESDDLSLDDEAVEVDDATDDDDDDDDDNDETPKKKLRID